MTDQAHVALLEANLKFDELDNFGYWFSREHPETEKYLNIRNIRPAHIRSSLFGEGNGQDNWETIRAKEFPHIQQSGPFAAAGMAVGQYLTGLFNLDGFIRKEEYLNESSLIARLSLAIGQHRDVEGRDERAAQASSLVSGIEGRRHMTLTIMPILQQQRNRSCGLVALESVRIFLSQSTVQASRQGEEAESPIISLWLRAIQRELGSPYDIRDPPTPGQTYAALENDESGSEMPNSQYERERSVAAQNADSSCTPPTESLINYLSTTSRLLLYAETA
ncbi:hypothetical protein EsHS_00002752 [Epichloe bromicola]